MFTLTITYRNDDATETVTFKSRRAAELAFLDELQWENTRRCVLADSKGNILENGAGEFAREEDGEDDE